MAIIGERNHEKTKKDIGEPLDRNKSELTHKLTALAVGYLAILGCKPIETEVPVKAGWIADVAGFTYPTMTELKNSKLLKRILEEDPTLKSLREFHVAEFYQCRNHFPLTVLAEIKVSQGDFSKDVSRKFKDSAANLNYLVIPKSLEPNVNKFLYESNHRWGYLLCSDNGEKILKAYPASITAQLANDTIDFIANIAIRRCHRTDYAMMRMMLKAYRQKERDSKCG